jgi:hypothetical protein
LKWWKLHYNEAFKLLDMELWTQDLNAKKQFGLNWVLGRSQSGLGRDCVHFGGNSGYQAMNLAYLWGAKRIILVGFDCKPVDGKDHWFGQHPKGLTQIQPYEIWRKHFEQIAIELKAEGVEVINCSPDTALTCFDRKPIETLA